MQFIIEVVIEVTQPKTNHESNRDNVTSKIISKSGSLYFNKEYNELGERKSNRKRNFLFTL